jgi:outer membrane protein TolC
MRVLVSSSRERPLARAALVMAAALPLVTLAPEARALQPLDEFAAAAKGRNFDNREAQATAEQRRQEARVAWARIGPSVVAKGSYTRNEYPAIVSFPQCPATGPCPLPPPTITATITAVDQLNASFTLNLPIVDVGAWHRVGGATATAEAARIRTEATGLDVEKAVVRGYYQVVAYEATLAAAVQALETAKTNQTIVATRREGGAASELDTERARAEVERARQVVATAEQARAVGRRTLETLTGLTPSEGSVPLPDDGLGSEPDLASLEPAVTGLPTVRAAAKETRAADKAASAAWAALAPTVSANAVEQLTNATGFTGKVGYWTATVAATWTIDPANYFTAKAQSSARTVAEVREKRVEQQAKDDLHTAWQEVRADVARARAAKAESEASARAARLARERYQAGAATQLDVQQADRDAFNSEVARIGAQADLAYARAAVRLDSGRPR